MRTNTNDEPIEECMLFQPRSPDASDKERDRAIGLLLDHLGLEIWRTNATKHGNVEIELRVTAKEGGIG